MREIPMEELRINPMTMFGEDWCLICAGNQEKGYNAMTVSWGQLGTTWGKMTDKGKISIPTATVFIRPQRYTKEFFDREDTFTICAFAPDRKKALTYMGTHSGREGSKAEKAGLTPLFLEGTTCFREASLVFVCRKLYQAPLLERGFVDPQLVPLNYPLKDFHEVYVGEIVKVFAASPDK